ncbi:hypothetical protein NM208_g3641 [Fusarium decemcellulare]|uniref:Uncharacterized protein n=1 Tax=Fusarium decemcellulare TaxID=57161 RepID=A0ACC1SNH7_9HYPO|nr:hypothetical protein NM208_g3641 [Fusarium decemcellulare]
MSKMPLPESSDITSNSQTLGADAPIDVGSILDDDKDDDESGDELDVPPLLLGPSDIERVLFSGKSATNPYVLGPSIVCDTSNLGSYFEQQARNELNSALMNGFTMADLQTYCFLAEYAVNSGYLHGSSATNLFPAQALAQSLVQLSRAQQIPDADAQSCRALTAVTQYLAITRAILCIGNPNLHSTQQHPVQNNSSPGRITNTPASERLEILLRVQELCCKPFAQQEPRPWDEKSEFRRVQEELDRFLVRWPGTWASGSSEDSMTNAFPNDTESHVALLIGHCSVILLNRIFLPIPRRRTGSQAGQVINVDCVNFPSAPDLFIKERISRCEASVAAICLVCKDMIEDGQIFAQSFWVGFSCVQCALVLIDRLHASPVPGNKIAESLKFTLAIVASLRQVLKPANDWIELLFRLCDPTTCLTRDGFSEEESFLTYFGRYAGVVDEIRIPLSWKPSPAPSKYQKRTARPSTRTESPMMNHEPAGEEVSWIEVYTGQLDSDAAVADQLEPVATDDHAISTRAATAHAPVQPMPPSGPDVDVSEILNLIFDNDMTKAPMTTEGWPSPLGDVDIDFDSLQGLLCALPTDWTGLDDDMGWEGEPDSSLRAVGNGGTWA